MILIGDYSVLHLHAHGGSAAQRLKNAFTYAGVCVYTATEERVTASSLIESLRIHAPHVLVYVRTHGLKHMENISDVWDACRHSNVVSVAWMVDLHVGLDTSENDHIWAADVVVSADRSEEARLRVTSILGAQYMHVGEGAVVKVAEVARTEAFEYDVMVIGAQFCMSCACMHVCMCADMYIL